MTTSPATGTIAPPFMVEPAYLDRPGVWETVLSHGPYPLMAGSEGYIELIGNQPLYPFFRSVWTRDGAGIDEETDRLLHHEPFIRAAGQLFGAEVVRPANLIVNVMGPMHEGGRHVDTPTFRGLRRAETPMWLLVVMGMSGLFDRWTVRVAGALSWFYEKTDGEFEYWPNGVDAPSVIEHGPFENVALVADNDLMYHQVGPIGDVDAFSRDVPLTLTSRIHPLGGEGWEIRDGDAVAGRLDREHVRVSLLWKAITFADERAARIYDEHQDDLDLDTVASVFCDDLTRRGVTVSKPANVGTDKDWAKLLTSTYMTGRV